MKPMLCLLLSLFFCAQMEAYEWMGLSPDLNGVTINSVVDGQTIVLFGEAGKVYSNVLAKAGCDFGKLSQGAAGHGDAKNHYTQTSVSARDHAGVVVIFDIVLVYHKQDGRYDIRELVRREK
jgi:hypothetical protein